MKEINFFVSPHFSGEVFKDQVSGQTYKKSRDITVYNVRLSEDNMTGLMEGFRKNFLIPYDRQTHQFVREFKVSVAKPEVAAPIVEEAPVVAPIVEEAPVVKETPKKKQNSRKRQAKKVEEKPAAEETVKESE